MNIGEIISDELRAQLFRRHIEIGNVFKVPLDESNGITPKGGMSFRPKFFIILGIDNNGDVYGGVVVNSTINKNVQQGRRDWHYPIDNDKYDFLDHNSFVDCTSIKVVPFEKLQSGYFAGQIDNDDLSLIIGAVKDSGFISKAELKRFNI